jgi:hypothetical protein
MTDHSLPVIFSYSRAQALEDGVLVDVSAQAKQAGFTVPVALTQAVWDRCVTLSPAAERAGNDEAGRTWDILWMLRCAIRAAPAGSVLHFSMLCVTDSQQPQRVELEAHIGTGDDAAPVLTIMFPGES